MNTVGCTTGLVNANDVITRRLTRSKAAVWTVDDVMRLIEIFFKKNSCLFIMYFLPLVSYTVCS